MRASLFIGRFQPFHIGHATLINSVAKTGKPVIVAVRDTPIDAQNPLPLDARVQIIREYFTGKPVNITVIPIPDIDEICYGRDVGYAIREIRLDPEVENISGTKIRAGGLCTRKASCTNNPQSAQEIGGQA